MSNCVYKSVDMMNTGDFVRKESCMKEDIMDDYAKTLNIDDVSYFSEIFRYAKRSGGDIPAIIKQTTKMIREKSEVQMEIDTIISGRKMEQKIMVCIPLGILIYLNILCRSLPLF